MEQKQRFFIYGRKEMGVLVLLAAMVAVFAFTLGVHLGKKVNPKPTVVAGVEPAAPEVKSVESAAEQLPSKQEISEQSKNVDQAAEDSLGQALHSEVTKTGIKLDQSRQLDLPRDAKSGAQEKAHAGKEHELVKATAEIAKPKASEKKVFSAVEQHVEEKTSQMLADEVDAPEELPGKSVAAASGQFTLQVGSYPSSAEAEGVSNRLQGSGLDAFVQSVELKGKGKWYRVYVGQYASKAQADQSGRVFQKKGHIQSFIVGKLASH